MDQDDYLTIARSLPRPSLEQISRFAWFVSAAHSWYKHLPPRRSVPFIFFLDPNAGRNLIQTPTGERAMVDVTPDSRKFHYTWQTTEDYRRRFGFWNYFAPYGSTFYYETDGGVRKTGHFLTRILNESGAWVLIPRRVNSAGTAKVNALVHPYAIMHGTCVPPHSVLAIWNRLRLRSDRQAAGISRFEEVIEERVRRLIATCGPFDATWSSWQLFDEDWEAKLRSQGATDRGVEQTLRAFQWRLIEATTPFAQSHRPARSVVRKNLERHRQITAMTNAMRRVVATVHDR